MQGGPGARDVSYRMDSHQSPLPEGVRLVARGHRTAARRYARPNVELNDHDAIYRITASRESCSQRLCFACVAVSQVENRSGMIQSSFNPCRR